MLKEAMTRESLDEKVLEVEAQDVIELLPRTDGADDYLVVAQGKVFAGNAYGNVGVYDLQTGQKISEIYTHKQGLDGIATDGKDLFLYLRNDFELKDTDILLAMQIEKNKKIITEYAKTAEHLGIERNEEDTLCEFLKFVNKQLSDLPKPMKGKASDNGIRGRIVSIPLDMIEENKVYDMRIPDARQRFVVGASANLHSHERFEQILVSYDFLENRGTYSLICENKAHEWAAMSRKLFIDKMAEKKGLKIPGNIVFRLDRSYDRSNIYPTWMDVETEHGAENHGKEVSMIVMASHKGGIDDDVFRRYTKTRACYQNDDKFYFLSAAPPVLDDQGASNVPPHELVICNLKWKDREKAS